MSGISHTNHQNRFIGTKSFWLSFPAVWPFKRSGPGRGETALPILAEDSPLPPSRRLILILPDADVDLLSLPRRVWNLAAPEHRNVLIMARPCREENEFHAQVNLITLSAMIRDPRVAVQTQLVLGQSLEKAVRQCAETEDIFVCFAEDQVSGFLRKRPLAEVLAQETGRPVYTLKGAVTEMEKPISTRLTDFFFLALCLVSLVAFFMLEVWIDRNSSGTFQSVLQFLAVIGEIWIISTIANKSFRL